MKATLATLACLLTVGFLSAASVDGNNTAVVIRKKVVESDTGFQFLCVPVDGLDIANGTPKTVKLSTFLPASLLTAGTQVTFVGGNNDKTTITVTTGDNNNLVWTSDPDLNGGQIFWLHYEDEEDANAGGSHETRSTVASYSARTTKMTEVVFCGQDRERGDNPARLNQMVAMCNDSSEAITLSGAVTNAAKTDILLTIQDGSSEYRQYIYDGAKWIGPGSKNCNDVEIAPGEAFYYYKRR